MNKVSAIVAAAVLAGHCLCVQPCSAAETPPETGGQEAPASRTDLTQGSLTAYDLPAVTTFGVADQAPTVPVQTRFGTQYNVVTEEQIRLQNSLDFYDALRNVPGVMYQKKNIIGGQTSASLYVRGRGASHPSPDINIFFDDVPRSGVLYGQALADGIPVYALGGMEIYKYPQPSRFGTGYAMLNFIPKYMTEEGYELRIGAEGGSFGTVAENVGMGAKKDNVDIYAAQSLVSTLGHKDHTAAYQASYYGNMGIGLSDNWSLRMMANRVDAQTQVPNNPITNTRTTDRYDTQTSLATLSLINKYNNANGYPKAITTTRCFICAAKIPTKPHRCKLTICTDCEAAKPIPFGKAARSSTALILISATCATTSGRMPQIPQHRGNFRSTGCFRPTPPSARCLAARRTFM